MSLTVVDAPPPTVHIPAPRTPSAATGRGSTLHRDLPSTIAVDSGSRRTAAVCRIGNRYVGGVIINNPEPAAPNASYAIGLSPEYGYVEAIWKAIVRLAVTHQLEALAWWETNGTPVPAGTSPWLFAIEKVNLPNTSNGRTVSVTEVASVFAAKGIAENIAGRYNQSTGYDPIWVRPYKADTRWETAHGGTGNPYDYYPARILDPYPLPADHQGEFVSMDHPDLRNLGLKDLAAAWSVASDAGRDYAKYSGRMNARTVVPPAQGTAVREALMTELRIGLGRLHNVQTLPKPTEMWIA